MSWDVMVFKFAGTPPSIEEFDESNLQPMGAHASIRERISQHLPGVDWSDPTWGNYERDGLSFEFNMGEDDPITNFMVHVRGTGDAIAALMRFAVPSGWTVLDCSTGEFLDPANPSDAGWTGFQAFRDRVIGASEGDDG